MTPIQRVGNQDVRVVDVSILGQPQQPTPGLLRPRAVVEASVLGFPPGDWPHEFYVKTDDGSYRFHCWKAQRDPEGDLLFVVYVNNDPRSPYGTIDVLND